MDNLENSYNELKEGMTLTREEFVDRVLTNQPEFAKYAHEFMDANTGGKLLQSFLEWSWNRYQDEHKPAHENGWQEAKPQEYNFDRTYEEELYGRKE